MEKKSFVVPGAHTKQAHNILEENKTCFKKVDQTDDGKFLVISYMSFEFVIIVTQITSAPA